jgi:hypothetical protein
MCLFGSYNVNFESWITAAEVLIAVVHGDTIADRFSAAADRPDISFIASVAYWSIWVFFSLTIMFNISLSIFEHMLELEIDELAHKKDKKLDKEGAEFIALGSIPMK